MGHDCYCLNNVLLLLMDIEYQELDCAPSSQADIPNNPLTMNSRSYRDLSYKADQQNNS